jgi:hypothetical protein
MTYGLEAKLKATEAQRDAALAALDIAQWCIREGMDEYWEQEHPLAISEATSVDTSADLAARDARKVAEGKVEALEELEKQCGLNCQFDGNLAVTVSEIRERIEAARKEADRG